MRNQMVHCSVGVKGYQTRSLNVSEIHAVVKETNPPPRRGVLEAAPAPEA